MQSNFSLKKLDLIPETDLYGGLLFQGKRFQNIESIHHLDAKEIHIKTKDFKQADYYINACLSEEKATPFILGNPLLRDVLLQSIQIPLTHQKFLPISIDKWEIYNCADKNLPQNQLVCKIEDVSEGVALSSVYAYSSKNALMESISKYKAKGLEPTKNTPSVEILNAITSFFNQALHLKLDKIGKNSAINIPYLYLLRQPNISNLPKVERHIYQKKMLNELLIQLPEKYKKEGKVMDLPTNWESLAITNLNFLHHLETPDGKPNKKSVCIMLKFKFKKVKKLPFFVKAAVVKVRS